MFVGCLFQYLIAKHRWCDLFLILVGEYQWFHVVPLILHSYSRVEVCMDLAYLRRSYLLLIDQIVSEAIDQLNRLSSLSSLDHVKTSVLE